MNFLKNEIRYEYIFLQWNTLWINFVKTAMYYEWSMLKMQYIIKKNLVNTLIENDEWERFYAYSLFVVPTHRFEGISSAD